MRVLVTCHGAYGHFHPLAPLALAAQGKGHDVLVATGPALTDWVVACGLRAASVGLGAAQVQGLLADLPLEDPSLGAFHRFSTVAVPPFLQDLLQLARTWRPDIVVHEEGEYAAPLFAALAGIPCVTHSWPSPARPEQERQVYRDLLQPIWAAHGTSSEASTSGSVYLDACPPPYQSDEITSIPGVLPVRPLLFDGPPTPVPPWVATLRRPAVYVTFGTVQTFSQPAIIRAAVEAMEPLVEAVVVTTGPNDPNLVRVESPRVRVASYLAQSQILPRVDLVVSHGGAGTTLGALAHGLPHLVMAGGAPSQQRNAATTQRLGLGLSVSNDAPPEQLRDAAQRLLTDQSYRAAGRAAAASLERLPSLEECVSLIENLA